MPLLPITLIVAKNDEKEFIAEYEGMPLPFPYRSVAIHCNKKEPAPESFDNYTEKLKKQWKEIYENTISGDVIIVKVNTHLRILDVYIKESFQLGENLDM